ncbi:MAG: hypothetical protein A3G27_11120 [Betaproteobacteria bacterium RIFCSPLOWO2_12_FULL_66_14]|nr:MAG: hypothetical protein A3G27_11120 [Betaproteobacteria bacterium RIFCSPLOWO2_12_FULL_66_14]
MSFSSPRRRAVKQRAEKASGTRPSTKSSVSTGGCWRSTIPANASRESSMGMTQRRAPRRHSSPRVAALYTFKCGPATNGRPRSLSTDTAPMSFASTT